MPPALRSATTTRTDALRALYRRVHDCSACLRMTHTHTLTPANGPVDARVLFVAEAPGRRGASITGVPLSGDEAGRRFERFLALAGLNRSAVFVTNAVLCSPRDARGRNRTPTQREVAACRGHLESTLDLVQSALVVALGRVALEALGAIYPHYLTLKVDASRPTAWRSRTLIPLYHPGRQSTLHRSQQVQEADWLRLRELVTAGQTTVTSYLSPVT
jgi:uracil-DNA glycosylase family 4